MALDGLHIHVGKAELFSSLLPHAVVILLGFVGFVLKVVFMCWLQLSIRWTLPRFRYDQVMRLGWRVLLPLSLGNILLTGFAILVMQSASAELQAAFGAAADLTKAAIAVGGLVGAVVVVRFLLSPPRHRQSVASTSARFAAAAGGTRDAEMGA